MAITIKKAQAGKEDLVFDDLGNGATVQTLKSDGNYRTVHKINASHLPVTSVVRAKKYADGTTTPSSAGDATVDSVLEQVLDDLEDLGQPDGSTLTVASGALKIKDGGVGTTQLAAGAVTLAKMAVESVDSDQYVDGSIDTAHLAAGAVTLAKMAVESVDSDQYVDGSIDTAHLADDAVTPAKLNLDGTGTGPGAFILYSGTFAGNTTTTSEVTGLTLIEDTDIVLVTVKSAAATKIVLSATPSGAADKFTVTFAAAPTAAEYYNYIVVRATA